MREVNVASSNGTPSGERISAANSMMLHADLENPVVSRSITIYNAVVNDGNGIVIGSGRCRLLPVGGSSGGVFVVCDKSSSFSVLLDFA